MDRLFLLARSFVPFVIAVLSTLASFQTLSQDGQGDSGNLEQPTLPPSFQALSAQNLEGTYTVVHYKNELIEPAHDTDKRWLSLKETIEQAAIAAYPFDIKLSSKSDNVYALVCDSGPSADPECSLYSGVPSEQAHPKIKAQGLAFIIPGDGCFYVAGHTDNMYDTRRKFCESGDDLTEVRQPSLYVGITSQTVHNIALYSDRSLKLRSGIIPPGAFIQVLVDDDGTYLVRDEFGITGWAKIAGTGQCYSMDNDVGGICFAGD
jgi:hypothetical protein